MQRQKKRPKPPRNLKSSKVTHNGVTLTWDYDGDNPVTLFQNNKLIGEVTSPHEVTGLDSETEYKFVVGVNDGEEVLASEPVTITTLKYVPVTGVIFNVLEANVLPNRPTRLHPIVFPTDASIKGVTYETTKGVIKDGYITLENVGDVADVVATSLDNGIKSNDLKVNCVEKDIPITELDFNILEYNAKVGETKPISVNYAPTESTQRAVDFEVEDESVLKVFNDGGTFRFTGLKEGKTKVKVVSRYNSDVFNEREVTILPKDEEVVEG